MPVALSDAQERRLQLYEDLLRERALPLGLVAASDADRLGERHIGDSLRAAEALREDDALLADIGPGAGLPGIVLAIARPELRVVLVEPKQKAVGFLELTMERLGLTNVEILAERVEDVDLTADVATARAYGPIDRSWAAACRVLRAGGRLIYFAGEGVRDPEREGQSITEPERADSVEVLRIAESSPLVIMTRELS